MKAELPAGLPDEHLAGLSQRRREFVQALVWNPGMSGQQAAILAGYAEKSAAVRASRLLRDPRVSEAVRAEAKLRRRVVCKLDDEDIDAITAEGIRRLAQDLGLDLSVFPISGNRPPSTFRDDGARYRALLGLIHQYNLTHARHVSRSRADVDVRVHDETHPSKHNDHDLHALAASVQRELAHRFGTPETGRPDRGDEGGTTED